MGAWGAPAARFEEALTSGPQFGSTWDALRLIGLLQKDVQALREDVRTAPAICEATRWWIAKKVAAGEEEEEMEDLCNNEQWAQQAHRASMATEASEHTAVCASVEDLMPCDRDSLSSHSTC